ncbi:MAG: acetyl-CoA carboxylase biotin carboxyl carrier protein [Alphaproteobacteria bacterium]|nr:acetyl-CoA carboxylase biotin carboxyl carrier protein [Alphaproteobacteria bacterium]
MSEQMDKLGITEMKIETSLLFGLFRREIELSKKQNIVAGPMISAPVAAPAHISTEPVLSPTANAANAIKSPMVGVVYLSAEPGAPKFIEVGKSVKAGDTLCLIEAMKTFNKVLAEKDGVVREILISESQAVEFDQPLVVIE